MIIEALITILVVVIIAMIANWFRVGDKKPKPDIISIKESMDLCNLPVVTFMNNGNKFNFVLDTGATESHVSSSAMSNMVGEASNRQINVQGFTGSAEANQGKFVDLIYKDRVFTTEIFESPALDQAFAEIKQNLGVQLHGIIGSVFLREHGYVLDFFDLIAYSKK